MKLKQGDRVAGFSKGTPNSSAATGTSEAAIFARLFDGRNGRLSPSVARKLLSLTFDRADQDRMEELAQRNQSRKLTSDEREELTNFVRVGDLLAILHSKARQALNRTSSRTPSHA